MILPADFNRQVAKALVGRNEGIAGNITHDSLIISSCLLPQGARKAYADTDAPRRHYARADAAQRMAHR
jgi:hypothetical protein